jgi:hypothetical protein
LLLLTENRELRTENAVGSREGKNGFADFSGNGKRETGNFECDEHLEHLASSGCPRGA